MDPMRVSVTYPSMNEYAQFLQEDIPWAGIRVRRDANDTSARAVRIDFLTRGNGSRAYMTMSSDNARALAAAINLGLQNDSGVCHFPLG